MEKISIDKIVGSASDSAWSQVLAITGEQGQKLLGVLSLSRDAESTLVDVAMIGAEILTEIEKGGLSITSTSGAKEWVAKIFTGIDESIKVELMLAWVNGGQVRIYGVGEVGGYIAREGQLARLGSQMGGVVTTEGVLRGGDVMILATKKMIEGIGLATMKKFMLRGVAVAENLTPLIHNQEDTGGVAGVILQVGGEEEKVRTPQIQVRQEDKKRVSFWVGGVMLLLLVVMIGVGMVRREVVAAEREYNEMSQTIAANLEEAQTIGEINPDRARQLLVDSRSRVEEYLGGELKEAWKTKATMLLAEIATREEQLLKKNTVNLVTVVELAVLSSELESERMQSDNKGNLVWLDSKQKMVVSMNLTDRSKQVVEGGAEGLVAMASNENNVYILDKQGVWQASWKQKQLARKIEADEFWVEPTIVGVFAGNVYVFDKAQSEIWKYPTLGETYGSRRRWLAAGITPDLSRVVDMEVGGDIWLLTETGKLLRYSRGAPAGFVMEAYPYAGEDKILRDPRAIYLTENTVYILEKGASRVVAVSQEGKFGAQYENPEFAQADDLVVVDDRVYVLIDNVVKEFGL